MAVGLKKRRRIQLIVIGFVLMGIATALIGNGFKDGIEFFRSPSQVAEQAPPPDETFRIGGLVEEGSLVREGRTARFIVTDGGASVPVVFTGILPDLFSEGTGMIGTGKLVNGTFEAREILAKHDENYMPKEVADALKEQGYYKEPSAE
jgi:cytochrome c-type biogenesis protein CcmE